MKYLGLDDMIILKRISKEGCTKHLECWHFFLLKKVLKLQNEYKVSHFEEPCDC